MIRISPARATHQPANTIPLRSRQLSELLGGASCASFRAESRNPANLPERLAPGCFDCPSTWHEKMNTTRRHFIKLSTAGMFSLGVTPTSLLAEKSVKPLRILILGGTGFTGPYQLRYALSRGHKVTTFTRGKSHPGELPSEVDRLIGDRNGQLDALKGRTWDVVIDNPTTLPAWVRDAAQILKGNVDRYVFTSTISVYTDPPPGGVDENSTLEKYDGPDPYKETLEAMKAGGYKTYGPFKVLSEKEAEKWFPGK